MLSCQPCLCVTCWSIISFDETPLHTTLKHVLTGQIAHLTKPLDRVLFMQLATKENRKIRKEGFEVFNLSEKVLQ